MSSTRILLKKNLRFMASLHVFFLKTVEKKGVFLGTSLSGMLKEFIVNNLPEEPINKTSPVGGYKFSDLT